MNSTAGVDLDQQAPVSIAARETPRSRMSVPGQMRNSDGAPLTSFVPKSGNPPF
jgi:hypothetical protein